MRVTAHSLIVSGELLTERERQLRDEDWSYDHDDGHAAGQLASMASSYALLAAADACGPDSHWGPILRSRAFANNPFDEEWLKTHPQRRKLVIAGALIIAEIERLDRLERSRTP